MHRGQHLPFLRLIHLHLDKTVHPMWLQLLRAQYILQQVRRQMGKGVLMLRLRKPGMNLHCCCWRCWSFSSASSFPAARPGGGTAGRGAAVPPPPTAAAGDAGFCRISSYFVIFFSEFIEISRRSRFLHKRFSNCPTLPRGALVL